MSGTRASALRQNRQRRAVGRTGTGGYLDIDLSALPKNMEALWVRESVLGDTSQSGISRAMQRGYEPAMATQYPDFAEPLLPGQTRKDTDIVRRGGSVLMVRDKRIGEQERAEQRDESHDAVATVQRMQDMRDQMDGRNFKLDTGSRVSDEIDRTGAGPDLIRE